MLIVTTKLIAELENKCSPAAQLAIQEHSNGSSDQALDALLEMAAIRDALNISLANNGFEVIRILAQPKDERTHRCITALMSILGTQIRIFKNKPLWREIGVDLLQLPNRSEGIGESPLHMDFVNASNPPDFVCLFCVRKDPVGGGESIVAQFDQAVLWLDRSTLQTLEQPVYRDGVVVNLENVGEDINPFPIRSSLGPWTYRFTGHLRDLALADPYRSAALEFATALDRVKKKILLEPGDLLVLDQRRVAHGKLALGPNQGSIPTTQRRLLLQGFIRK